MWRIIFSIYLFVSVFNILFFIKAINVAKRAVYQEMYEYSIELDKSLGCDGASSNNLADGMVFRWYKAWPYLLYSICPIWHFVFFYTFLTHGDKIEQMFYMVFRGKAEQYIEDVLEELKRLLEEEKKNDCE